jgi:DNA-binding CsgD family transcriptional regulator
VRSAILGEVDADELRRLHLRAAALLHAGGAAAERVAAHLLEAPAAGEPWAAAALTAAADQALARGVPDTAAHHLARLAEEPLGRTEHAEVLLRLGRVRLMSGDAEALAAFEQARATVGDPRQAAQALHGLGQAHFSLGRHAEAAEAFEEALALADADEAEGAGAAGGHAFSRELRAHIVALSAIVPSLQDAARRHVADVLATQGPLELGDRAVLAALAVQRTFTIEPHQTGRDLARRALGDAGELLAAETSDGMNWMQVNAVLTWTDDLPAAITAAGAALDDARRRGSISGFATASFCRATPHLWSGRLADAAADAQQALDARRFGWGMYTIPAAAVLAWSLTEQLDLDGADAALAPFLEDLDTVAPHFAGYLLHARGRLHAARGDFESALQDQLEAGRRLATDNPAIITWRSEAAVAAAQLGRRRTAIELADEELERAERFGAPRTLGIALRAKGVATGGVEGRELLQRAVQALEGSTAILERVRALTELGAAHRMEGDDEQAKAVLRQALDRADRTGARLIAARARAELVKAGARPRRAQITGAAALTPAERRTAELAARGLTNREIAETLFVTLKTVEWHLGRAYGKLRITGRPELADALLRG